MKSSLQLITNLKVLKQDIKLIPVIVDSPL